MTELFNIHHFLSFLYRCIPTNKHAIYFLDHILMLEQVRDKKSFIIKTIASSSINDSNENEKEKEKIAITILEKLLQKNKDKILLTKIYLRLRLIITSSKYEYCQCSTQDCLIQFAKAFAWIGGVKYLIPAILANGDIQLKIIVLQIITLFQNLAPSCSPYCCPNPPDNFKCIQECLELQSSHSLSFNNVSGSLIVQRRRSSLLENRNILQNELLKQKLMAHESELNIIDHEVEPDIDETPVLSTSSFLDTLDKPFSSKFKARYNTVFNRPPIESIKMKSFDLLTWEHVCTDFIYWISFFSKKCILSVPVIDFCLFYLTREYTVEYVPSNRVGPEYGTQNTRFASMGDFSDTIDDDTSSQHNTIPKRRIVSNPQLLYFMLKEIVKAPSQSIIYFLEQLTFIFLADPSNIKLFLSFPEWQSLLLNFFITSELPLDVEKQIVRLVLNVFTTAFHYYFLNCENILLIMNDTVKLFTASLGWNNDCILSIRLILYTLLCKIQSSIQNFIMVPNHVAWLNLFRIVEFIHNYACKMPCKLKIFKKLATAVELDDYSKFGLHFTSECNCPDYLLYHKLTSILAGMKIHAWEEKIKTHLDSCDGNQGIFNIFNSNYNRGLNKLIENIAAKGIYAYKYSSAMMSVLTITESYTQNHIKTLCNEAALAYSKFYKAEFDSTLCKTKIEVVNALPIEYFNIDSLKVASPWHYVELMFDIKQVSTKRGTIDPKSSKALLTVDDSANSVKKKSIWDKITNSEESVNSDISAGLIESFGNRLLFERNNGGDLDIRKRMRDSTVMVLSTMFLLKFNNVDIAPAVPNGSLTRKSRHQRTLTQDLESIQLFGKSSLPLDNSTSTHANSFDIGVNSALKSMDNALKEHRKTLFQRPSPDAFPSSSHRNASVSSALSGSNFQITTYNDAQSEPVRKPIWQRQTIGTSYGNSINKSNNTSETTSISHKSFNNFFTDVVKIKSPIHRPILSNAFTYGTPLQSSLNHKRTSVLSSPSVSQEYTTTASTGNDLKSTPEYARTSMISASRSQPRTSMIGLNGNSDVYGFIPVVPKLLQVHSQKFQEIMDRRKDPKASNGKHQRSISLSGPSGRRGSFVDK